MQWPKLSASDQGKVNTLKYLKGEFYMATGKCCTTLRGEYSALRRQIYELEKTEPSSVIDDFITGWFRSNTSTLTLY